MTVPLFPEIQPLPGYVSAQPHWYRLPLLLTPSTFSTLKKSSFAHQRDLHHALLHCIRYPRCRWCMRAGLRGACSCLFLGRTEVSRILSISCLARSLRQDFPDADPRLSIGTVANLGNAFIHGLSTGQDLVNLVNGQQTFVITCVAVPRVLTCTCVCSQKRQDADGNPFESFVQQFFKDHPNQVFLREQAEKRQDAFANFLQQFFANSNTLLSRTRRARRCQRGCCDRQDIREAFRRRKQARARRRGAWRGQRGCSHRQDIREAFWRRQQARARRLMTL
ncbi:hypothetical protein FA95DRAFT_1026175 [Auriscalpium vulgare]|uniref:Uncharacterized protein n=1 Tax=Auriscalpium vulgare TaxID=40419 RepID=A0ACB8RX49_9AGAM|nr:hypothetical protein FA95DRAFT_1026175 [Auriscalpium vulgare]